MRSFALFLLCGCLAVVGAGRAAPTFMAMQSVTAATSMHADCPDMTEAMPASSRDVVPADAAPGCCRHDCACAAHVALATTARVLLPGHAAGPAAVAMAARSDYASPALARLVRPPIA